MCVVDGFISSTTARPFSASRHCLSGILQGSTHYCCCSHVPWKSVRRCVSRSHLPLQPATRLPVRLLLPFTSACLLYLLCCLCFLHFALPSLHPYPSHSQIQPIHPPHTSYRIRKLTSKRRGATITTHHGCSRRRRPPASYS